MEEQRSNANGLISNMNPYTMLSNSNSRAKNNVYISKMFNQQRYNDGFMSDSIGKLETIFPIMNVSLNQKNPINFRFSGLSEYTFRFTSSNRSVI